MAKSIIEPTLWKEFISPGMLGIFGALALLPLLIPILLVWAVFVTLLRMFDKHFSRV